MARTELGLSQEPGTHAGSPTQVAGTSLLEPLLLPARGALRRQEPRAGPGTRGLPCGRGHPGHKAKRLPPSSRRRAQPAPSEPGQVSRATPATSSSEALQAAHEDWSEMMSLFDIYDSFLNNVHFLHAAWSPLVFPRLLSLCPQSDLSLPVFVDDSATALVSHRHACELRHLSRRRL